jgi:hypothetical protein
MIALCRSTQKPKDGVRTASGAGRGPDHSRESDALLTPKRYANFFWMAYRE